MKKDKVRWPTQKESFCGPLEVELLVAENKQLRAQVELLTHEKQVALSMWREQRNKNEVGYPFLHHLLLLEVMKRIKM